jgi:hypothetical protein
MASKKSTKLTKKDIESVADKLQAFAQDLPEQERDVLGWILTRAQAAPSAAVTVAGAKAIADVPGYRTRMAAELAKSAGLRPTAKPEVTVVVGWVFRFGRVTADERLLERARRARDLK